MYEPPNFGSTPHAFSAFSAFNSLTAIPDDALPPAVPVPAAPASAAPGHGTLSTSIDNPDTCSAVTAPDTSAAERRPASATTLRRMVSRTARFTKAASVCPAACVAACSPTAASAIALVRTSPSSSRSDRASGRPSPRCRAQAPPTSAPGAWERTNSWATRRVTSASDMSEVVDFQRTIFMGFWGNGSPKRGRRGTGYALQAHDVYCIPCVRWPAMYALLGYTMIQSAAGEG